MNLLSWNEYWRELFNELLRISNRAEKGRNDIHVELNNSRAAIDGVAREKVDIDDVVYVFPMCYFFVN